MKQAYKDIIERIIDMVQNLPADAEYTFTWDNMPCTRKKSLICENSDAERVLHDYYKRERITLLHGEQDKAFYSPTHDIIMLPSKRQFKTTQGYYATLAHETIHSTGEYTRCYREGFSEYMSVNTSKYSREELTAETGACFLLHEFNIDMSDALKNAAFYIKTWRDRLSASSKWIYDAGDLANEAVEYILNNEE